MKFTWKLLFCMFGRHEPGSWRAAVGGRNIRTCIYCDKLTDDKPVGKERAKAERYIGANHSAR